MKRIFFLKDNPHLRTSLYALGVSIGVILTTYGILSEEEINAWLGVLVAIINVLAMGNINNGNTIGKHSRSNNHGGSDRDIATSSETE